MAAAPTGTRVLAALHLAARADDGTVWTISPARLPACETCFAMTIHRSQGSQFDHAVVVLPDEPSP